MRELDTAIMPTSSSVGSDRVLCAFCPSSLVLRAPPAAAQIYEIVGTRAQGMGGAFVAVADDATATWWNPAGLATRRATSVCVMASRPRRPTRRPPGPAGARRRDGVRRRVPSLGLSYYRLRISEMQPRCLYRDWSRPTRRRGDRIDLRTLLSQFGATVGQSLGGTWSSLRR